MSDDVLAAVLVYGVVGTLVFTGVVLGVKELVGFFRHDVKRLDDEKTAPSRTKKSARSRAEERADETVDVEMDRRAHSAEQQTPTPAAPDPTQAALFDAAADTN